MADKKYKKHIDDYCNFDEFKIFSMDDLKNIEGTEDAIQMIKNLSSSVVAPWLNSLKPIIETYSIVSEFNKKCDKNISEISQKYNWFIAGSMKLPNIKMLLEANQDKDVINNICIEYYKNNMQELIQSICKKYPKRKEILEEAYIAHQNKNYHSSIVLFFTQTDGISHDLMKKNFFQEGKWKEVAKEVNDSDIKTKLAYCFFKVYFEFEGNAAPIRQSAKGRKNWKINHLNRHQVLHGEVVNFNTEINSLKAFSLLVALTASLEKIKKWRKGFELRSGDNAKQNNGDRLN